jgi:hypothetical protein
MAGPLKVKDYAMTVSATDSKRDNLTVMFRRVAGKGQQMHMYSFSKGVKVTANPALSKARIKGSLGKYGKIDLALRGPGAVRRGATPKGCTGKAGKLRAGTLKGTFRLIADSTYFKRVSASTLKAQLATGGKLKCDTRDTGGGGGGGGGATGTVTLMSTTTGPQGMLTLMMMRTRSGAVTQQVMRTDDAAATAPASIMHMINTRGTSAAFEPAADLSSARGTGVTPFLSGSFTFAADTAMGDFATGELSGDLAARFDSIGTQQLGVGASSATLMRR